MTCRALEPEGIRMILLECLAVLDASGFNPFHEAVTAHFSGFGLWFRNRFCHPPGAPLNGHHSPDGLSAYFSHLVIRFARPDSFGRWLVIDEAGFLEHLKEFGPLSGSLRPCQDDEL